MWVICIWVLYRHLPSSMFGLVLPWIKKISFKVNLSIFNKTKKVVSHSLYKYWALKHHQLWQSSFTQLLINNMQEKKNKNVDILKITLNPSLLYGLEYKYYIFFPMTIDPQLWNKKYILSQLRTLTRIQLCISKPPIPTLPLIIMQILHLSMLTSSIELRTF